MNQRYAHIYKIVCYLHIHLIDFSPSAEHAAMTPQERERMNWLCQRIQDEKDPKVFDDLVVELNELLEVKHGRIHPDHKAAAPKGT